MIKWFLAASVAACSPAYAALTCFEAVQAAKDLAGAGYNITFGDASGEVVFFLLEKEDGWIMVMLKDGAMCPIAGGVLGVHSTLPPNI